MILNEETYRGSLYWITSSYTDVLGMLKKNSMQLKPRIAKINTDFPYKKLYYKSFSRLKMGGFARTKIWQEEEDKTMLFTLEFDGEKLNRNFKIKPFSFYDWKAAENLDIMNYNENEEVLVTDKPEIKNIRSYIKAIHFYSGKIKNIDELYEFGIPVYVHTKAGMEHLKKGEKNPSYKIQKEKIDEVPDFVPIHLKVVHSMFFPKENQEPNSTFKVNDLINLLRTSGLSYNSKKRAVVEEILKEAKKRGILSVKDFKDFIKKNSVKRMGGIL